MKFSAAALAAALLVGPPAAILSADTSITAQSQAASEIKSDKRKDQVNKRLVSHNKKIRAGIRKGTISQNQGNDIARQDKAIRDEKKGMEESNGGKLSKSDQKKLNKKLNDTGDAINDINEDAAAKK